MTGTLLVWLAFLSSLTGTFLYVRAAQGKGRPVREARLAVLISVIAVAAAAVLLLFYILQHRFENNYVFSYSSRDLPTILLVTTFWAGQEGSFLLWALCGEAFGLALQAYAKSRKMEYEAMAVYGFLQTCLLLLLIVKSPFLNVWEVHPDQVGVGQIPVDGRGLNPLLQNLWMAIHPPMLFVGFASLAVPFALAVASLWRRHFQEWPTAALPWVLFAVVMLGLGIMLGGYWAYGVLGWGGWWGWDPVENSSLIPWVVAIALLHTLVVQKKNGGFVRTNFVLALLAYILVVYSTFLTRSGILGEASVHSFVDPGAIVYGLLVGWVAVLVVLAAWSLRSRWPDLRPSTVVNGLLRKDTMLGWTTVVLAFLAFVVFIGTNWPLFGQGALEPAFYNKTTLPLGMGLALLLAFSLSLQWEEIPVGVALRRMATPFGLALALTLTVAFLGVTDLVPLAFSLLSAFAMFMNIRAAASLFAVSWLQTGGPVAHTGFAILLLGIIGSGFYSQKETVVLRQGERREILGHTLLYTGGQQRADGKWEFTVQAGSGSATYDLKPVMFKSDYNNSVMRNPDYVSTWTRDFYIEPVSLEQGAHAPAGDQLKLVKGQPVQYGPYVLTFVRFDMQNHTAAAQNAGAMIIGAVIKVQQGRSAREVTPVSTFVGGDVRSAVPAQLTDSLDLTLAGMNIDVAGGSIVVLQAAKPGAAATHAGESLVVEASVKPMIGLVWLGSLLTFIGAFIAMLRRRQEHLSSMPGRNGERHESRRPEHAAV